MSTGNAFDDPIYTDGGRTKIPRKMRKGSGSPSICWHCLKQLQRAPGRGLGLFYFHLVKDRAGIEHRVHGDCLRPSLEGDDVRLVAEVPNGQD